MPEVINDTKRLLSFYVPTGVIGLNDVPVKKKLDFLPTKRTFVDIEEIKHISKSPIFIALYNERAIRVRDFDIDNSEREPTMNPKHVNPHKASVDVTLKDPATATPDELPSTETIEPTPMGGVNGNAKQAKESIKKNTDTTWLHSMLEVETRASVKKALVKRIDELEAVDATDED